jgi:hypothetical protein
LTAFPQVKGCFVAVSTSAPGGIRTPNLLIRSQMLYPLSYGRSLCKRVKNWPADGSRAARSRSNRLIQPIGLIGARLCRALARPCSDPASPRQRRGHS